MSLTLTGSNHGMFGKLRFRWHFIEIVIMKKIIANKFPTIAALCLSYVDVSPEVFGIEGLVLWRSAVHFTLLLFSFLSFTLNFLWIVFSMLGVLIIALHFVLIISFLGNNEYWGKCKLSARSGKILSGGLQTVRLEPGGAVTSHPRWSSCICYFFVKTRGPLFFIFLPHRWWNKTALWVLLDLTALFHLEAFNKGGISGAGTNWSLWTSHFSLRHMCLWAAWSKNVCVLVLLAQSALWKKKKKKKTLVWFGRQHVSRKPWIQI